MGETGGAGTLAADLAAADAQVPVVHPVRNPFLRVAPALEPVSWGSTGPLTAPRAMSARARAARGVSRRCGGDVPWHGPDFPEALHADKF